MKISSKENELFMSCRYGLYLFLIACTAVLSSTSLAQTRPERQPGDSARGGFITGKSSVVRYPSTPEMNCGVSKVSFEAGSRTIWHSHAGGQVIVVTSGTAWYQEKGKPKQILKQGDAIIAPMNVMHWHGATPDAPMVHTVATPNQDKGGVTSGAAVTDEEYKKVY